MTAHSEVEVRPEAPLKRRGRTLSFRTRGAVPPTVHGPLQRLLGARSAKEAVIAVFVHQGDEFIDAVNDWHGLVTVPFHVVAEPEDAPAVQ